MVERRKRPTAASHHSIASVVQTLYSINENSRLRAGTERQYRDAQQGAPTHQDPLDWYRSAHAAGRKTGDAARTDRPTGTRRPLKPHTSQKRCTQRLKTPAQRGTPHNSRSSELRAEPSEEQEPVVVVRSRPCWRIMRCATTRHNCAAKSLLAERLERDAPQG